MSTRLSAAFRSKEQLESKLQRPGTTHLVKRIQGPEAGVQGGRSLSERRLPQVRIHESEVGVIENVERLSSELQLEAIMDWEVASNGKIHLPSPKSSHEISGRVASLTIRSKAEGIRIYCPATRTRQTVVIDCGTRRPFNVNRLFGIEIQPGVTDLPSAGVNGTKAVQGNWKSRTRREAVV